MSALLCPKCTNIMSRYERNGVVIDQCSGCGGLFLDRGELEHLIQAEAAFYGHGAVARPVDPVPRAEVSGHPDSYRPAYDDRRSDDRDRRSDDRGYDRSRDDDRREYDRKRKKKKAMGFLEDLLDF